LENTASKDILIDTGLPSQKSVVLAPGEVFTLNTTVASSHPVFINLRDPITKELAHYFVGKKMHVVFPKLYLILI
jgi:hypothetical protein